ncbi:hypothetical protein ACQEV4_42595 [Streptomyces shenzhenensis]|uniref:hypothetical protein n=1 Tax=Streptomyces shenzhenensis TaxID=943815 RepID=UPI003D8F9A10
MTAIEETRTDGAGQCTRGSSRLSVDDATRALTLPHLPYGDAVRAALDAVGLWPSAFEAGLRTGRTGASELFLRAVWPAGAPLLGEIARPGGVTVAWSHVTGWSVHNAYEDVVLLDDDALADPAVIADAARHYARHGLDRAWRVPRQARWEYALELDIALVHFDERGAVR